MWQVHVFVCTVGAHRCTFRHKPKKTDVPTVVREKRGMLEAPPDEQHRDGREELPPTAHARGEEALMVLWGESLM